MAVVHNSGFRLTKGNLGPATMSAATADGQLFQTKHVTEHFLVAVPVAVISAAAGFLVSRYLSSRTCKKGHVNTCFSKDSPKVVHSFDMEDIGTKAVYCRCWKSKKFPYCDGAHTKHNEETGDNVGPLIIKKRDA